MNWKIAEAKQRFSELVKAAESEPQWIYNRDRLVAAVVPPEELKAFQEWHRKEASQSLGDAFAELRRLCEEEGYKLALPSRRNRPNSFADVLAKRPR